MNSRVKISVHCISWMLLWLLCDHRSRQANAAESVADEPVKQKLNVVFILADDLGWGELGCYGQQKIPTPNLDRLASEGMRFTQHYSGAPVCAPSRCVLMTGKHLGHAEIRGNKQAKLNFPEFSEGQHPLTEQAITLAQVFQRAGYATGAMGKWGLGPVGSTGAPDRKGFDLFFGYNCQSVAHSYYPSHLWRNSQRIEINHQSIAGHQKRPTGEIIAADFIGQQYAPTLMIAEAEKFIDEHARQPFFLYLPFIEPHVAMHPPQSSVDRFPIAWDDAVYRGQCSYLPHPRPRAAYAAMISDLDSYVGRVLKSLQDHSIADRTLVIFSSDNGTTHAGQPNTHFHIGGADPKFFDSTADLRGYKGSVYEGGIRVPMLARLPGKIPAGTVNDAASYFADWFPTLCEAAGLQAPKDLDGESLWTTLNGDRNWKRTKPMLWVFPEYGGQVAVRMGAMKVVRQNIHKAASDWELYDLSHDRSEKVNIAVQHPELVQAAKEILQREALENKNFPLDALKDAPKPSN